MLLKAYFLAFGLYAFVDIIGSFQDGFSLSNYGLTINMVLRGAAYYLLTAVVGIIPALIVMSCKSIFIAHAGIVSIALFAVFFVSYAAVTVKVMPSRLLSGKSFRLPFPLGALLAALLTGILMLDLHVWAYLKFGLFNF